MTDEFLHLSGMRGIHSTNSTTAWSSNLRRNELVQRYATSRRRSYAADADVYTNNVRSLLAEPDSGPSRMDDLRTLRPGDGGDAGVYRETHVCPEPAGQRLRDNTLRRRCSTP